MSSLKNFKNKIICGDCLKIMSQIPDNSVDAVITDPPYELGFMGKKWDISGISKEIKFKVMLIK